MALVLSGLYPILDDAFLPGEPGQRRRFLQETVAALADAGVTIVQYRNKRVPSLALVDHESALETQLLRDCEAMRQAAPSTLRLILNDRADLVAATGFDGVHIGQGDGAPQAARVLIGAGKILGISTHNGTQLQAEQGADYVAIGPVFATSSKLDTDPVVGLQGLRLARSLTAKPLVAIGGITLAQAAAVRAAGADSLAVISALLVKNASGEYEAPVKLAKDFLEIFR